MAEGRRLTPAVVLLLLWLQASAAFSQQRLLSTASRAAAPFTKRRALPVLMARKRPSIAKDASLDTRMFDPAHSKLAHGEPEEAPPSFPYAPPKIFCARSLEFVKVKAMGFDMDHTLAVYTSEFNKLAFESAKKLLISYGYPKEISSFEYDENHYVRGLQIDINRGYIYKPDRFGMVRKASYGLQELTEQEIAEAFPVNGGQQSVNETAKLDCFFNFVDFSLFGSLVDFAKKNAGRISKTHKEMYADMRKAVHTAHNDGSIKNEIAKDPAKYITLDAELVPTLQHLRKGCHKSLFLLTNSEWEYANVVMSYLTKDSGVKNWYELFDAVITDAKKPAFFQDVPDTMNITLKRVNPSSAAVTDVPGIPFNMSAATLKQGNTFCGGNYDHLQNLLELRPGDEVLYVGDHIWADILRPKKSIGWRTCLILPEIQKDKEFPDFGEQWIMLRELQAFVEQTNASLATPEPGVDPAVHDEAKRDVHNMCRGLHVKVTKMMFDLLTKYHNSFSTAWGSPFKGDEVDSWFAKQITDHACLYTDKVSRFGTMVPVSHLTTMAHLMPHHGLSGKPLRSSHFVSIDGFALH